ncbi:hypothetical protein [Neobacillus mesonae]|uniref:hypothetical protein n=1 Tax=Neobacillus mesonae TaxID=1193713 RepID=UPI00204233E3|nr:hypothetical protein [Neobacillus mesonae]MCM3567249.1 hypothetical protein [Neobacillus mesonae]
MNTLKQAAGAAGTAIAITLFTAGQTSFAAGAPNAAQSDILAAGVKYTFYFGNRDICGCLDLFFLFQRLFS